MMLALQRGYDPDICFWVRVARDLFYVYVVNDSCVRIVHDVFFFLIPFNVLEGWALCRRDSYGGTVTTEVGEAQAVRLSKHPLTEQRVGGSIVQ